MKSTICHKKLPCKCSPIIIGAKEVTLVYSKSASPWCGRSLRSETRLWNPDGMHRIVGNPQVNEIKTWQCFEWLVTRITSLVSFHFFLGAGLKYQLSWLSWLTQKFMPCFTDFCFITIFLKNLLPPGVLGYDSSVQSNHHELRALILSQAISCSVRTIYVPPKPATSDL